MSRATTSHETRSDARHSYVSTQYSKELDLTGKHDTVQIHYCLEVVWIGRSVSQSEPERDSRGIVGCGTQPSAEEGTYTNVICPWLDYTRIVDRNTPSLLPELVAARLPPNASAAVARPAAGVFLCFALGV